MSTSILYHGFGLVNVKYLKTEFKDGAVIFWLRNRLRCCARCDSFNVIQRGTRQRKIKTLPIGIKTVWLQVQVRRLYCLDCHRLGYESNEKIAKPKKHYSNRLARYACDLSRYMTIADIARHLGLHWNTVWEMVSIRLRKRVPKARDLRKLRYIGIDEIAIRKRHHYMTIAVDHLTGRIVYAALGRSKSSLRPFLKRLRRLKAPIQVVTMDVWRPYFTEVSQLLPEANIVFDRYHLVANLNRDVDQVRREEFHRVSRDHANLIKGTRFLLLRHENSLDEDARMKLDRLFHVNRRLALCYELKEMLHRLWSCLDISNARQFIEAWVALVRESAIKPLMTFAKMVLRYKDTIVSYFKYPLTNALVEGTINKIKVLKRDAYGYRNRGNFTRRIYSLHKTKYSLIG